MDYSLLCSIFALNASFTAWFKCISHFIAGYILDPWLIPKPGVGENFPGSMSEVSWDGRLDKTNSNGTEFPIPSVSFSILL